MAVFEWPSAGKLYLPGLKTPIVSARLLRGGQPEVTDHETSSGWTILQLPPTGPEKLVSVIELDQNQQNSSHNYQKFPIGWVQFPKPGKYRISVSCLEGDMKTASLTAIRFAPIP